MWTMMKDDCSIQHTALLTVWCKRKSVRCHCRALHWRYFHATSKGQYIKHFYIIALILHKTNTQTKHTQYCTQKTNNTVIQRRGEKRNYCRVLPCCLIRCLSVDATVLYRIRCHNYFYGGCQNGLLRIKTGIRQVKQINCTHC